MQARDFIVLTDKEQKSKLAEATLGQSFIAEAPVVIVVCANRERSGKRYGERGRELYSTVDASLATQNLMLSAVEKGLGTVYVGAFNEEKVSQVVNAPDHVKPIGLIPVGYPDEEPAKTPRFRVDKLIQWGSF